MKFIILFLTLTLLAFAGAVSSQTQNPEVDSTVMSPYTFAELVNRNSGKRDPTLKVDLVQIWKKLKIQPQYFATCGPECKVEVYSEDLDGAPGNEVILKLTSSTNFCRFLIFRSAGKRWEFLGHLDHEFNRYQMAKHRVEFFNGKPWLLIRGQSGSGTGFSLYNETWYEVGPHGLRDVLNYPVDGHTYPGQGGLGREFEAQTLTYETGTPDQLVIRYVVRYTKNDYQNRKQSVFITNEHRVHLVWNKETKSFDLDESRSNISGAEIFVIAGIESEDEEEDTPGARVGHTTFYSKNETKAFVGGGYEVFLKYNLDPLLKIARDKNHEHHEWLRLFLNDCDDTDEKRALLLAIKQA